MPHQHTTPPSLDDIAELAERALQAIPEPLRRHVQGISILVEDAADDATLAEMGLDTPWDLSGLYRGVPLPQHSVGDVRHSPDMVLLYREPILLEWVETGEDLFALVRTVLIHEIAHHFGFSDAEIDALEQELPGEG